MIGHFLAGDGICLALTFCECYLPLVSANSLLSKHNCRLVWAAAILEHLRIEMNSINKVCKQPHFQSYERLLMEQLEMTNMLTCESPVMKSKGCVIIQVRNSKVFYGPCLDHTFCLLNLARISMICFTSGMIQMTH